MNYLVNLDLAHFFFSISGISETSPLHQYNLTGDVGDDEVFMVRFSDE